jgi:hypothetical protein
MSGHTTSWERALDSVRALAVTSAETFSHAAELCRLAKASAKSLDKERTDVTHHLVEAKRKIDDLFRPPITALATIERELKAKMAAYDAAQRAAREAVMVQSAAEHAAGLVPTAPIPEPAAASGVSMRDVLDFEIVDPAAVPRRYCVPDPTLIREVIRAAGDIVDIPGVRVFRRTSVAVRR